MQQPTKIINLEEKREARMEPQPVETSETMRFDANTCPTCNTPIRDDAHGWVRTAPISEQTGWKSAIVPCPTCSGDVQAKREARRKAAVLRTLFGGANIPWEFEHWTFASFPDQGDHDAKKKMQAWVKAVLAGRDLGKRGLYLQGIFGIGKTSLAISALKDILHAEKPGLFISTNRMLDRIRSCYAKGAEVEEDAILGALIKTDYVVIDDLGAERVTDYAISMLHTIFEQRLYGGKYTIVTSNRPLHEGAASLQRYWSKKPEQEQEKTDPYANVNVQRLVERIGQHCHGISLKGDSIRHR